MLVSNRTTSTGSWTRCCLGPGPKPLFGSIQMKSFFGSINENPNEKIKHSRNQVARGLAMPGDVALDAASIAKDSPSSPAATIALGRLAGNLGCSERNFHNLVQRAMPMRLDPIVVKNVPHLHSTARGIELLDVHVMAPHEVFACYFDENRDMFMDCILGGDTGDGRREYWHRAEATEWFQNSSFKDEIVADPCGFIPFRLWNDDVAVTKTRSLTVTHISSALASHVSSLYTKLLCFGVPLGFILPEGLDMVVGVVVWSLVQLMLGTWPATDWRNEPWPATHWRAQNSGRPLAGRFRGILAEITADWKALKEILKLPQHYGKTLCCHRCVAQRSLGPVGYMHFHTDAVHRRPESKRTHAAYMGDVAATPPALTKLPWFHLSMVLADFMHCVCLGAAQSLVGNVLFACCVDGAFGYTTISRADQRRGLQLRQAWLDFKQHCKVHHIDHSQQMFTRAMLSMKSDSDAPMFKGKAANTMDVVEWLASLHSGGDHPPAHIHARGVCVRALARLWRRCKSSGRFFTPFEARSFHRDMRRFLLSYRI